VFHDNYLGKDQITITLNFSKGAMNVVGQLYQFIRMGFPGYREINRHMQHTAERVRRTGSSPASSNSNTTTISSSSVNSATAST
jgi:glutamate decarboxylase